MDLLSQLCASGLFSRVLDFRSAAAAAPTSAAAAAAGRVIVLAEDHVESKKLPYGGVIEAAAALNDAVPLPSLLLVETPGLDTTGRPIPYNSSSNVGLWLGDHVTAPSLGWNPRRALATQDPRFGVPYDALKRADSGGSPGEPWMASPDGAYALKYTAALGVYIPAWLRVNTGPVAPDALVTAAEDYLRRLVSGNGDLHHIWQGEATRVGESGVAPTAPKVIRRRLTLLSDAVLYAWVSTTLHAGGCVVIVCGRAHAENLERLFRGSLVGARDCPKLAFSCRRPRRGRRTRSGSTRSGRRKTRSGRRKTRSGSTRSASVLSARRRRGPRFNKP